MYVKNLKSALVLILVVSEKVYLYSCVTLKVEFAKLPKKDVAIETDERGLTHEAATTTITDTGMETCNYKKYCVFQ